jgi:hypothetical protein
MFRICDSQYGEILWLETFPVLGEAVYRERERKTIRFYYCESAETLPEGKRCPGQALSAEMAEYMIREIFGAENFWKVQWRWETAMEAGAVSVRLTAVYYNMEVPVSLALRPIRGEGLKPGVRQDKLLALGERELTYPIYAPENRLSHGIFTIVERLELISDMESYYEVYQILKNESLKGRRVVEEMRLLVDASPRVKKEQRLEQVAGYRSYAYMKKRWKQYLHNHGREPLSWEDVLDLILVFLKPIWHCLCNDEVFFDDWMPEIGRFI